MIRHFVVEEMSVHARAVCTPLCRFSFMYTGRRASVKLFELGVRTPGVYFGAYAMPEVSILGVFRTPISLPIFSVIFILILLSD